MKRVCLQCGTSISDKREGAKFCSLSCKNKYQYERKTGLGNVPGQAPKLTLVKDTEEPPRLSAEEKKDDDKDKLDETRRGVLNKNPSIDADIVEEEFTYKPALYENGTTGFPQDNSNAGHQEKEPVPDMFILETVSIQNPAYGIEDRKQVQLRKQANELRAEYQRLEGLLKTEAGKDGSGWIVGGGIGGGLLALWQLSKQGPTHQKTLQESSRSKKRQHKQQAPGSWEYLLKIASYAALGAGLGWAGKHLTHTAREHEKKTRIEALVAKMNEIAALYGQCSRDMEQSTMRQKSLPKTITQTREVLNPEYLKWQKPTLSGTLNGFFNQNPAGLKTVVRDEEIRSQKIRKTGKTGDFKAKSNRVISAKDLGGQIKPCYDFKGVWKNFIGTPSIDFHILVHGQSGEGKSTFCIWFARYLAENFGRVLYVSAEEGTNKTFQDKLKYCNAVVHDFYILAAYDVADFLNEVGTNEFHFIILDSLHDLKFNDEKLSEVFKQFKGTGFICIQQNNKNGDILGANAMKHLHDVVISVVNYQATTTKNRFTQRGQVCVTENFSPTHKPALTALHLIKGGNEKKDSGDDNYNLDDDRRNFK